MPNLTDLSGEVIANPTGTGVGNLSTVRIGGDVYTIPNPSGGMFGSVPINAVIEIAGESRNQFTDAGGNVWLRSGFPSLDFETYPNAFMGLKDVTLDTTSPDLSTIHSDYDFNSVSYISPDGRYLFFVTSPSFSAGETLRRAEMSTPFDLSTLSASTGSTISLPSGSGTHPRGFSMSDDGLNVYYTSASRTFAHYSLTTAWDLSTATRESFISNPYEGTFSYIKTVTQGDQTIDYFLGGIYDRNNNEERVNILIFTRGGSSAIGATGRTVVLREMVSQSGIQSPALVDFDSNGDIYFSPSFTSAVQGSIMRYSGLLNIAGDDAPVFTDTVALREQEMLTNGEPHGYIQVIGNRIFTFDTFIDDTSSNTNVLRQYNSVDAIGILRDTADHQFNRYIKIN